MYDLKKSATGNLKPQNLETVLACIFSKFMKSFSTFMRQSYKVKAKLFGFFFIGLLVHYYSLNLNASTQIMVLYQSFCWIRLTDSLKPPFHFRPAKSIFVADVLTA